MNYYNEFDPFAAAWLRELIKAGHIAKGEVDERSIEDVVPGDLKGFRQCHFFAGIGVWSYALRSAGWSDDREVWTGSCPCQPFSAAGKRAGVADERHLWPAFYHLIGECKPAVVFGEQVASKDGLAWLDTVQADLEGAHYAVGAADLCAAGLGAPHIRQRLYFVAHAQHSERRSFVQYRQIERNRQDTGRPEVYGELGARGEVLSMAHSADPRRTQAGQHGSRPSPLPARFEQCGGNGQLGNANDAGSQGRRISWDRAREWFAGAPSLVGGFWEQADWLYCRDGKCRPVEPGTFPLAHGTPNRVGRLRGYGNALCAPVAQTFIESVMESLGEK